MKTIRSISLVSFSYNRLAATLLCERASKPLRTVVCVAVVLALLLGFSPAANATLTANQCDITTGSVLDQPSCPSANPNLTAITLPTYNSVRSDPGKAGPPIDVHGICRYVGNISTVGHSLFVPFRSAGEWRNFISYTQPANSNLPVSSEIKSIKCARPGSISNVVPSNFKTYPLSPTSPFYTAGGANPYYHLGTVGSLTDPDTTCDTAQVASVTGLPYGRAETDTFAGPDSFTAAPVTFNCTANGTPWILTATATFTATPANDLTTLPEGTSPPLDGDGWQLTNVVYSGTKPSGGACGSANGVKTLVPPTTNLCASGTASSITTNLPPLFPGNFTAYLWTCSSGTGTVATCCADAVTGACTSGTPGVCGPANSVAAASKPTTGLCSTGTPFGMAGTGPWTWDCVGTGDFATTSCATATVTNGTCGSANGVAVSSAPAAGLCSTGTASTVGGTGPWSWTCTGSGGGTTASCSASTGGCGSAYNVASSTAPSVNLCAGSFTLENPPGVTSDGTSWSWICMFQTTTTLTQVMCTAPVAAANGTCGSANTGPTNGAAAKCKPTTNLCSAGTPSAVIGNSATVPFWTWNWTCAGSGGGTTTACSSVSAAGCPFP